MSRTLPTTVLYVAWAPFFSGAERALVILLEHLDPVRYRPVVALGTRGQLQAELQAKGISTMHVPIVYAGASTLPSWLWTVGKMIRAARLERVAIIHSNDVPSFQPAGYAGRLLGVPAVTHVRFPDTRAGFEWFLKPGFDAALFVSAALQEAALAEAPRLFAETSEVVHDGVRVAALPDEGMRDRVRRELGLPVDQVVVAFTGQVAEIKGIWEFIDAAGVLASRAVPATFVVLGDDLKGNGALREHAQRMVAERGLTDRVRFLGFRADAPRLIPCFDIVAVPSHLEPLGNATLEAMSAARPVVGSRVGGIPEMVVDGVTGTLVPPRDATRLADAVDTLVRDPERRRSFGLAGRRRAIEHFGVEAYAGRVQAVYDRVLATASAKRPGRAR
jgi:glycosyltransferase involved in cell wall biosynthesis